MERGEERRWRGEREGEGQERGRGRGTRTRDRGESVIHAIRAQTGGANGRESASGLKSSCFRVPHSDSDCVAQELYHQRPTEPQTHTKPIQQVKSFDHPAHPFKNFATSTGGAGSGELRDAPAYGATQAGQKQSGRRRRRRGEDGGGGREGGGEGAGAKSVSKVPVPKGACRAFGVCAVVGLRVKKLVFPCSTQRFGLRCAGTLSSAADRPARPPPSPVPLLCTIATHSSMRSLLAYAR
jgi:hypothetical protein